MRLENVPKGQHDIAAGNEIPRNRLDRAAQKVDVLLCVRIAIGPRLAQGVGRGGERKKDGFV